MADNSEELKLRITPELDQAALDKVKKQMEDIPSDIPMSSKKGGKGSGDSDTKREVASLKQLLAVQNQIIRNEDLRLRKVRSRAEAEIRRIRETASTEKMSLAEINNLISTQESIISQANIAAQKSYNEVGKELDRLRVRYDGITEAEKQVTDSRFRLFYANQRLTENMNSMSGSMARIESQTKMSSLAFMNFGRIVQDAPFGLIGIANNIDPLLVSFSMLSQEIDKSTGKIRGAMGAFKAMGAQLFGPAGLIFLLGSALPSALLLLQKRQQEATKESDKLAEAFKRVAEEFANLVAEAAGEKGLKEVTKELTDTENKLKALDKTTEDFNKRLSDQAEKRAKELVSEKGNIVDIQTQQKLILDNLKTQNKEEIDRFNRAKESLELNRDALNNKKLELEAIEFVNNLAEEQNVAQSKRTKDQIAAEEKIKDLKQEQLDVTNEIAAEIFRQTREIEKRIVELNKELADATDQGLKSQLAQTISALEIDLTKVKDRVIAQFTETLTEKERLALEERKAFLTRFQAFADSLNREGLASFIQTEKQKLDAVSEVLQEIREKYKKEQEQQRKEFEQRFLDPFNLRMKQFDDQMQGRLDLQLMAAESNAQQFLAIEIRREMALQNLKRQYQKLGLSDTQEYLAAEAALNKDFDRQVAMERMDQAQLIANAIGASFEAIFGENKALASSIVIVDTIMGIQKALTSNADNLVKGFATAAMLAAQGAIALRKINATKRGDKSINGSQGETPTTRQVMAEGIGPRAGQIITTNGTIMSASAQPQNNVVMPDISIDARVDRRGLAIAVREGEQEIRTQQFSYT